MTLEHSTIPNILSIAGTDPTGGAGIQADLKAFAAGGGYGMAVVTALVAQNTLGVREVHVPSAPFLRAQLDAVSSDVRIDALKIGMLGTTEVIATVRQWLEEVRGGAGADSEAGGARAASPLRQPAFPVVLDPVMIAASGDPLIEEDAAAALREIVPLADLVTPNLFELAALTHGSLTAGCPALGPAASGAAGGGAADDADTGAGAASAVATTWEEALDQGRQLARESGVLVLVKGGHLSGDTAPDALVTPAGETVEFPGSRIRTENTHGTGCSLSSGIAARIARHPRDWAGAIAEAKAWLRESLSASDTLNVGAGSGPLHHLAGLWERGGLTTRPSADEVRDEWWAGIAAVREETEQLGFIRGLADGTLDREYFLNYIAQDSVYLIAYSRVLARLSELAPTPEEQAFWAQGAHGAILGELELHRARLGDDGTRVSLTAQHPSAVTSGYVNHLLAASTKDYAEAVAAVLPCYWMYCDLGQRLFAGAIHERASLPDHPYAEWIATYDDPHFAEATDTAIGIVTRVAASATPDTRDRMWRAFYAAAVWEREFFGQTPAG